MSAVENLSPLARSEVAVATQVTGTSEREPTRFLPWLRDLIRAEVQEWFTPVDTYDEWELDDDEPAVPRWAGVLVVVGLFAAMWLAAALGTVVSGVSQ